MRGRSRSPQSRWYSLSEVTKEIAQEPGASAALNEVGDLGKNANRDDARSRIVFEYWRPRSVIRIGPVDVRQKPRCVDRDHSGRQCASR